MLATTLEELDAVRASCRALVNARSGASALVAAVPLPGPDLAADVSILMEMIPTINRRFGLAPEQVAQLSPAVQGVVMTSISRVGRTLVGKALSKELVVVLLKRVGVRVASKSAAKLVPLLGSVVSAGLSFAAMRMLGNRHVDDCYAVAKAAIAGGAGAPVDATFRVVDPGPASGPSGDRG